MKESRDHTSTEVKRSLHNFIGHEEDRLCIRFCTYSMSLEPVGVSVLWLYSTYFLHHPLPILWILLFTLTIFIRSTALYALYNWIKPESVIHQSFSILYVLYVMTGILFGSITLFDTEITDKVYHTYFLMSIGAAILFFVFTVRVEMALIYTFSIFVSMGVAVANLPQYLDPTHMIFSFMLITALIFGAYRISAFKKRSHDLHERLTIEYFDRMLIEGALRDSERKYRTLVQSANSVIMRWNLSGQIIFMNEYGLEFFGYRDGQLIGRKLMETIIPEKGLNGANLHYQFHNILQNPECCKLFELENCNSDGAHIWLRWSNTPLFDKDKKIIEILSVGVDITDRIVLEEQLRAARKDAEDAERLKDRFISIVSHDLRGPVGAIQQMTDLLTHNPNHTKQIEFLNTISNTAGSLLQMIEKLLTMGKLQRGRIQLNRRMENIRDLVAAVISEMSFQAHVKQIEVANLLPHNLEIYIDKHLFLSVIRNLISNAYKFCDTGDRVEVSLEETNENEVILTVRDTGPGISDDLLPVLFRPDIRTSTPGSAGEMGNGLGLILCKELVEAHEGSIMVRSEAGNGTEFSIRLPDYRLTHQLSHV